MKRRYPVQPVQSKVLHKTLPANLVKLAVASIAVALLMAVTAAQATVMYTDKSSFLSATGAGSIGALPSAGGNGTTVGNVTFNNGSPAGSITFGHWSNEISGYDLAVSGLENFSMTIAGGAFSFGFDVQEPTTPWPAGGVPDGCNTVSCVDSLFEIQIWSGATLLDTHSYNPLDDPDLAVGGDLGFFGVHSAVSFDFIRVTEVVGTNDNEYFGNFVSGDRAINVPEPSVLALMGLGLAGFGFARYRK